MFNSVCLTLLLLGFVSPLIHGMDEWDHVNALEMFGNEFDLTSCLDSNFFSVNSIDIDGEEPHIVPIGGKWTIAAQESFTDSFDCLSRKNLKESYSILVMLDGKSAINTALDFIANKYPYLSTDNKLLVSIVSAKIPKEKFSGFYSLMTLDSLPEIRIEGARGLIGLKSFSSKQIVLLKNDTTIIRNHFDRRLNGKRVCDVLKLISEATP